MSNAQTILNSNESNRILYPQKPKWSVVETENTEIVYYDDNRELADIAARFAEKSYIEFTRLLEFTTTTPIQIHLYNNPITYANSITQNTDQHKSKISLTISAAYYDGNMQLLEKRIKKQVAYSFLKDMFFSSKRNTLQNQIFLYMPEWYINGLSSYLGEGWNSEDEMRLKSMLDLNLEEELKFEKNDEKSRFLKKSLWYYIGSVYGLKKVSELVYMTRLTRSVDGGFVAVLGQNTRTVVPKWIEFCKSQANNSQGIELVKSATALPIPLKNDERIVTSAIKGKEIAYITELNGWFYLNIFHFDRKTVSRKIFKSNGLNFHEVFENINTPLTWSPDGKYLLFCLPKNGKLGMFYYNVSTDKTTELPLENQFDWVQSLSWSPNGKLIALSGLVNGYCDLFVTAPFSSAFKSLTRDVFDDINPIWDSNSEFLYFSSNRDTALDLKIKKINYRFLENSYDIYEIKNIKEKPLLFRKTNTYCASETKPILLNKELVFLSDTTGYTNIAAGNGINNYRLISNFKEGISNFSVDSSYSVFESYINGKKSLFFFDKLLFSETNSIIPTLFAKVNFEEKISKLIKVKTLEITLPVVGKNEPENKTEFITDESAESDSTVTDSSQSNKKIRYYIFDEDDDKKDKKKKTYDRKKKIKELLSDEPEVTPLEVDINRIQFNSKGKLLPSLNQRAFRLYFGLDPLFRFYGDLSFLVEDPFEKNRLSGSFRSYVKLTTKRPFIELRNRDFTFNYLHKGSKFYFEYNGAYKVRFFELPITRTDNNQSQLQYFRYHAVSNRFAVHFPLDPHNRVTLSTTNIFINRQDLRTYDDIDLNVKGFVQRFEVEYTFNNIQYRDKNPIKGNFFHISMSRNQLLNQMDSSFWEAKLQTKYYTKIFKKLILETGLSGGANWGGRRQLYMLGGQDNWLLGYDFENTTDVPVARGYEGFYFSDVIMPLRGLSNNSRNGYYYGLFYSELQAPFSKLFSTRILPTGPLYNMRMHAFYNIGLAWRSGNPFSQRNPIDADVIIDPPLTVTVQSLKTPYAMGFGFGFQTVVLTYFMRADLAWGIEESNLSKPRFNFSIGKQF